MATLFNRSFEFVRLPKPSFSDRGDPVFDGPKEARLVRGTVQPLSGKETVPAVALSRNTGTVKVYSSERLDFRSEDGAGLGYVRCGGHVYELVDELPNLNGIVSHWKYIGCLVPPSQDIVTETILELVNEMGDALVTENGEILVAKL